MAYDWPGNVRQLENILRTNGRLDESSHGKSCLRDLPAEIQHRDVSSHVPMIEIPEEAHAILQNVVTDMERELILQSLRGEPMETKSWPQNC